MAKLEEKIESIDHVKDVLWVDDVTDLSFPVEMFPEDTGRRFFRAMRQ